VWGDRERIGQVLTNLISNAIKYSPKGGKIWISTKTKKDLLTVAVKDEGIGINDKQKEKVFDRFSRVGAETNHTFPGLGLGLYIAKEIIKRHNGTIDVESKEGAGTTFHFTLRTGNR
jgi:signal transduction histidine kinase